MNSQDLDVMYVQNPALGAVLLWRFTCGYYSNENRPVPFPLLFVVLPIVFRQDLCSVIKSTQRASGLSKVSEKLFSGKLNDSVHYINNTAIQIRELTLEAFNIAVEAYFPRLPFLPSNGLPLPSPKSFSRCASAISAFISSISVFSFSSHSSRV